MRGQAADGERHLVQLDVTEDELLLLCRAPSEAREALRDRKALIARVGIEQEGATALARRLGRIFDKSPKGTGALTPLLLSRDDLNVLVRSVAETLIAIDDWEFHALIGIERDGAKKIYADLCLFVADLPEIVI